MLEIMDALIDTAAVVLWLRLAVQAIQRIPKRVLGLKTDYMRGIMM